MDDLLEQIRLFCSTHGMALSRFGELALNDKPLVKQIENGRRLWPETILKIRRFMATYQPDAEQDAA